MALRKDLWHFIQPLPNDIPYIHDAWIALMASLLSDITFIDQPLINYRLHAGQAAAAERRKSTLREHVSETTSGEKHERYQRHLAQLRLIRHRIEELGTQIPPTKSTFLHQCMAEHEKHLLMRTQVSKTRFSRGASILKELFSGRYHRFSNGHRSAAADFLKIGC